MSCCSGLWCFVFRANVSARERFTMCVPSYYRVGVLECWIVVVAEGIYDYVCEYDKHIYFRQRHTQTVWNNTWPLGCSVSYVCSPFANTPLAAHRFIGIYSDLRCFTKRRTQHCLWWLPERSRWRANRERERESGRWKVVKSYPYRNDEALFFDNAFFNRCADKHGTSVTEFWYVEFASHTTLYIL